MIGDNVCNWLGVSIVNVYKCMPQGAGQKIGVSEFPQDVYYGSA